MKRNAKKWSAAAIGMPASAVIIWAIPEYGGPQIPAEVAASCGALITLLVSFLIPDHMEV